MRLLHELDAAVGAVLLHPQDEILGLFCCVFDNVLKVVKSTRISTFAFLALSEFLGLNVYSGDCFQDGYIKGCLAKLVDHKKMVRQISKLSFECEPIRLVTHQLMDCSVAVNVHTIVMGLNQVTLNVVESLHFNSAHFLTACPRPHRRVFSAIDELTDCKDGDHTEVLGEHES